MVMLRNIIVASLLLGSVCPALATQFGHIEESRRVRRGRGLLPSPPHLAHGSKAYKGCLGLSTEELIAASQFKDDMPRCEIVVDGTTVVANTVSLSSSESNSGEVNSSNSAIGATSTSSTSAAVYHEVTTSPAEASEAVGGSDDNVNDQNDEVDDYVNAGEENNDDSIEDDSGTYESGVSSGNEVTEESNTDNQAVDNTAADENSDSAEDEEIPNPLHLFDMNDCGTFSALWMWDLALTCSNSTSLDGCSCTAAKIHIQYGDIDCENDKCPSNCPVCQTCLKLSGCVSNKELQRGVAAAFSEGVTETVPIAFIGLTAAMFGIQLVLFKMYWSRRTQSSDALGSQLLDQNVV